MTTTRKFATIRTINTIQPIPDADRIEVAKIGGWQIIIPKDTHQAGERVVYIEIDAALPLARPYFAHLSTRKITQLHDHPGDWHVLKTARMRGVYSQGLILPLETVGDLPTGTDVTELLGIKKYEPVLPATTKHTIAGKFHPLIRKTDAERVQNLHDQWEAIADHAWVATRKLDGQSITVYNDEHGQMHVYSRNWEIRPEGTLYDLATFYHAQLFPNTYVQCEYVGPRIQGNRLGLREPQLAVFGYYSLNFGYYDTHDTPTAPRTNAIPRTQWPQWVLNNAVPTIPITFPETPEAAIELASSLPKNEEGIVWHTLLGTLLPELDYRECFKAINNKYLL
jgi:RNA ligase (TIGR02306 family)